jgi:hypothetical protein
MKISTGTIIHDIKYDKSHSLLTHPEKEDMRVPYDLEGQPIEVPIPEGYTKSEVIVKEN